jgi:glycosyltransferase involved in cell wall biosynthesis
VILFLHNRYRTPGGEERVVDDLLWLVREHLGEEAELFARDSAAIGAGRAGKGLLRGGLDADVVGAAVRTAGARVVHAHNLLPELGWRALAAARAAGARTVLHLHNYRLVCAVGTCIDSRGHDCTRCHGRDTRPGIRLNCRDGRAEAVSYATALALWQRRTLENADAVVVPSQAALDRLNELGAPLPADVHVVGHAIREFATAPVEGGQYALVASRLAREKDVATAIEACRIAALPLVVAGDGPLAGELRALKGADVRFAGRVDAAELARLRAGAAVALVPSLAHETFGLAALESMAAGLPVVAANTGALAELGAGAKLVPPADPQAMANAIHNIVADSGAGARALACAREVAAPDLVAARLRPIYDGA